MTRRIQGTIIAILLLLLLVAAGCDSDQPLQTSEQRADIIVNGFGALVPRYDVWDLWLDNDSDGSPDDINGDGIVDEDDTTRWCEFVGIVTPQSVPWDFSFRVSVLREGEAAPEVITSDLAATPNGNKAGYDSQILAIAGPSNPASFTLNLNAGVCSQDPTFTCNPNGPTDFCGPGNSCESSFTCSLDASDTCDPDQQTAICDLTSNGTCMPNGFCSGDPLQGCNPDSCEDTAKGVCASSTTSQRYVLSGARGLSGASLALLQSGGVNALGALCEGDGQCITDLEQSLGSNAPLFPPLGECPADPTGIFGISQFDPLTQDANPDTEIFGIDAKKGDTIIVEARLTDEFPGGGSSIIPFLAIPGIQAIVTIDGTQLQSDEVVGNLTSSDFDYGPNISFSFTTK